MYKRQDRHTHIITFLGTMIFQNCSGGILHGWETGSEMCIRDRDDEKDRIISNLQAQLEYFKQKLFGSSSERRSDLPGQLSLFSGSGSGEEPLPERAGVHRSKDQQAGT